jgi:hypothetical protein
MKSLRVFSVPMLFVSQYMVGTPLTWVAPLLGIFLCRIFFGSRKIAENGAISTENFPHEAERRPGGRVCRGG